MDLKQRTNKQGMPSRPSKEAVREWLRQRRLMPRPLPDTEQIRHELGCCASASTAQTR